MKHPILIAATLICACLPLHASVDEDTVKGHMIVNGKSIELTHA